MEESEKPWTWGNIYGVAELPWAIWYTIHFTYHHRHHLYHTRTVSGGQLVGSEWLLFYVGSDEKWKINNIKCENIKNNKSPANQDPVSLKSDTIYLLTDCTDDPFALSQH